MAFNSNSTRSLMSILAVVCLCFSVAALSGCRQISQVIASDQQSPQPVRIDIDQTILTKAGLKQLWLIPKLGPLDATIKQIDYFNGRLFAVSSTNQLYVLDGQTGHLIGSTKLSSEASFCSRPTFFRDSIVYMTGNQILQLDQRSGKLIESIPLPFPPSTNAVKTYNSYFVGSSNGRFYCMDPVDKIDKWNSVQPQPPVGNLQITDLKLDALSKDGKDPNPLIKEEDLPHDIVYFACKDNKVYASWADKRRQVWQAPTSGSIPGVILTTVDKSSILLVPSEDTSLRSFDALTGELKWKYLSGGKLMTIPCVTQRNIYQRVGQKSLICLLKNPMTKFGKLIWEFDNGLAFLAENGQLSYIATRSHELVCMDNASGKQKLSFYIPQADLYVSNTQDPTIFLANQSGSIIALKPLD